MHSHLRSLISLSLAMATAWRYKVVSTEGHTGLVTCRRGGIRWTRSLHVSADAQIPMPSSAARLAHPKAGLSQVTLHKSLTVQRTLYAALFVLAHAMAASYCVQTAGEPY